MPIAVCGEMAGDVQLTRLLLGLGLRNFSMHPGASARRQAARAADRTSRRREPLVERMRRTDEPEKLGALLGKLNA